MIPVGAARKRLGCSAQSVRRWISEGELVGEKNETGRWMISPESIDSFLARRKSQHGRGQHAISVAPVEADKVVKMPPPVSHRADLAAYKREIGDLLRLNQQSMREDSNFEGPIPMWLCATDLLILFHETMSQFQRPEKFIVYLAVDWSGVIFRPLIIETSVGPFAHFDHSSISYLLAESAYYPFDDLPSSVQAYVSPLHPANQSRGLYKAPEFNNDYSVKRFMSVYYDDALVCRSQSEDVPLTIKF